ncbi:hypothetical protein ABZ235_11815 [Streptomyces canus]|uniref:hypothetical protein n=1 Tax=Streptomyces canus TaxID=58343 RepID=UPI0033A150C8
MSEIDPRPIPEDRGARDLSASPRTIDPSHLVAAAGQLAEVFASVRPPADFFERVAGSLQPFAALTKHLSLGPSQLQAMANTVQAVGRWAGELSPDNWRGGGLDFRALVGVIEEGIPLAWVPPRDIVRGLIDAVDVEARFGILETNQAVIVESCHAALDQVTDSDWAEQVDLLRTCAGLLESGHTQGAQALAANVYDTLYRGLWRALPQLQSAKGKWDGYGRVQSRLPVIELEKKEWPIVDGEVKDLTVMEFRLACVITPLKAAYTDFYNEDPVPMRFNRHATAHAAGRTQYTPVNALLVLMLGVSLIRELQKGLLPCDIHA